MKRKLILILVCCLSILIVKGSDETMLKDCPKSPNCVSSQTKSAKHYIEPIVINDKESDIKKRLIEIVGTLKGEVLEESETSLKVSFRSNFFGFEDIAEFEINFDKKIVDVRSAAQTGWYDFGVNRKRVEKIRVLLK